MQRCCLRVYKANADIKTDRPIEMFISDNYQALKRLMRLKVKKYPKRIFILGARWEIGGQNENKKP